MTIHRRLNLVLCTMMALALLVVGICSYAVLSREVVSEGIMLARLQMATAQAIRQYTQRHVQPLVAHRPAEFHAEAVPAFAATTTLSYLQAAYPDLQYREVATNPTNPANRAQGWEEEALRTFRAGANAPTELLARTGSGAQERLMLAHPLRVTQACLRCHGHPSHAPLGMAQRYGRDFGYGWKVGDVIGAQVVSLSLQQARRDVPAGVAGAVGLAAILSALFFIGLNAALRRVVLSPIKASFQSYRQMASTDVLTALANRREFMARMETAVRRAERSGRALSVIVLDIDNFKQLNDTYGHAVGDEVLREFGRCLSDSSKRRDLPGRMGGEEFAVLLPGSHLRHAHMFATTLCKTIATRRFSHVGQVTASLGVAQWQAGESADAVLKRADDALYAAKNAGRNRVCCAD